MNKLKKNHIYWVHFKISYKKYQRILQGTSPFSINNLKKIFICTHFTLMLICVINIIDLIEYNNTFLNSTSSSVINVIY